MALIMMAHAGLAQSTQAPLSYSSSKADSVGLPAVGTYRAAPVNDDCANNITLVVGDTICSQTTDQGSTQSGEVTSGSCITSTFSETVWYDFTATASNMYVDVAVTGLASNGTWCPSRFTVVVYNYSSCIPAVGTIIGCETTGSDDVIVVPLTGLTIGTTYMIQLGYNDANGCKSPVFCITTGNTETPCAGCSTPCGAGCEFVIAPPNPAVDVPAACSGDYLIPRLEGSEARTNCYTFTAGGSSVDWGLIVLTNCTGGNSTSFSWELQPSTCTGVTQSGSGFSFPSLTGLTYGTQYTLCYTLTSAASCWQSRHWPYFVGTVLLPVDLLSFNAVANSHVVDLTWTTASEEDNTVFTIERSESGLDFSAIGSVAGHGPSAQINHYAFTDKNPLTEGSYRIKQVGINGTASYSPIRKVELHDQWTAVSIAPNPATKDLTVTIHSAAEDRCQLQIMDLTGRVLSEQDFVLVEGFNSLHAFIGDLHEGQHLVRLITSRGIHVLPLVKL